MPYCHGLVVLVEFYALIIFALAEFSLTVDGIPYLFVLFVTS